MMTDRLILLGVVFALCVGGLVVASDPARQAEVRAWLGMEPELVSDVERMLPEAVEAEIARLSALPVPGARATGQERPPVLGVVADAIRRCVTDQGTMLRRPSAKAKAAMMRYLLVLGATGADPDSPLLEPRFRGLRPAMATGPGALAKAAAAGRLPPETVALLADFHRTYARPEHPVYHGLQLYEGTVEALDFQSLLDRLLRNRDAVSVCALAEAPPPPPNETAGIAN